MAYKIIAIVSAIVMLHLQIVHVEEDFLIKTFGEEYLEYRKKYVDILEERGSKIPLFRKRAGRRGQTAPRPAFRFCLITRP